jgi:cell shape-determining protein MreC
MKLTTRFFFSSLICSLIIIITSARAQAPTPIIVQAASTIPATSSSAARTAPVNVSSVPEAIKLLEQMKASNQEILSKQEAALERLDELQKAADQLKIFTRRSTG